MDMNEIALYIQASRDVVGMLKTLRDFLPRGPDADAAKQRLEQAEKALLASEAQLAKALGYKLCQCTFPPQIMLSKGYHPEHGVEVFACQKCGKQDPSPHMLAQHSRVTQHNRGGTWGRARGGED